MQCNARFFPSGILSKAPFLASRHPERQWSVKPLVPGFPILKCPLLGKKKYMNVGYRRPRGKCKSQIVCAVAQAEETLVRFRTRRKLGPFEFFKITGSLECLGDWNRVKAPRMIPYGEDVWELDVMAPTGMELTFTCLVSGEGSESGEQVIRSVLVKDCEMLEVDFAFGVESSLELVEVGGGKEEGKGDVSEVEKGVKGGWEGKEIRFMESNDHPREREGSWNVEALQGLEKMVVSGDKDAGSWLQKLSVIKQVIVDDPPDKRPGLAAVALCHIYLSWISQGVIPCVESGGHRRPNHHAQVAMLLFRSLEWVVEPGRKPKELVWIARRLHTKLPSFSSEYMNSEPLTRIRDIAHRNDIPQNMKQEIKHTIQNKLHRNAGPEDLVASELMYERILNDRDNLSSDFVHQFGLFLAELRDFFNAGTLTQLLVKIGPTLVAADEDNHALNRFLSLKKDLDSAGSKTLGPAELTNKIMEVLHAATTVRAMISSRLQSGLRNDAPNSALSMRQCYRLSEIRLEEYVFVLLSRFINLVEETQGFENLAESIDQMWALPIGALVLGIRNVGMDGWDSAECLAVENELSSWYSNGNLKEPGNALRLKCSLERLQRLSESFCDSLLEILAPRAESLSAGLGVTGHNSTVFAESEIRSSVMFQLSKLNAHLLNASRKASGQSAWDMLVAGAAFGKLVPVETLDSHNIPKDISGNVVLLVKKAAGDEDVAHLVAGSGLGARVTGVVLCQELPHLSHLGVRARQEKLVFASCWDDAVLETEVQTLSGKFVQLKVDVNGVVLSEHSGVNDNDLGHENEVALLQKEETVLATGNQNSVTSKALAGKFVLSQADTTTELSGAKAGNCGLLEKISKKTKAFHVPKGMSLPFGSMQRCWDDGVRTSVKQALQTIDKLLASDQQGDELDAAVAKLHEIIKSQKLPADSLGVISDQFETGSRVIVRSSSNMEDMAGMSGAGLHDSIPNIDPSSPEDLSRAITGVWASLHTKRALQSRNAVGIPHANAEMGVLIQEQLFPDVSFVLHTTDPISKNSNMLQAEIAPGIGETLASGARGTPWRFSVDKTSAEVATQAFANFSKILMPHGVTSKGNWIPVGNNDDESGLVYKVADYSVQPLSTEAGKRDLIGRQLVEIGTLLEAEFGGEAQDVEGAVVGNHLYIVQSRPQPV